MWGLGKWIVLGLLVVGGPFAGIGISEALDTREMLRTFRETTGTVVGNRLVTDHRDGNDEQAYQPEVEFRDTVGNVTRFTDPAGSLPPDYAVGESVQVLFDPAAPAKGARLSSWKRLWLVPTILTAVGFLPAAVGAIVFFQLGRAARR